MEGFDEAAIFFSDNFSREDDGSQTIMVTDLQSVKLILKQFIKNYHDGSFEYIYRDALKGNYSLGLYFLDVNLEDLAKFDEKVCERFHKSPTEHLPIFEEAATEVADELTRPRPPGEEDIEHIQIMFNSHAAPASLRSLKSDCVSKLVKIPGIVIASSGVRAKATKMTLQCRGCGNTMPRIPIKPGFDGYTLPRRCNSEQAGQNKCPLDPYQIRTDSCECVDFQVLKLQELTEAVPQGEMPRHVQLYCDRFLCEKVMAGNRVVVIGVYSIKKHKTSKKGHDKNVGVRTPYLRVIGINADTHGAGHSATMVFTPEEEEKFRELAASPDIYEKFSKSVAPSIFGFEDIKKAIACLLMGGSRKKLPDGLYRRGDINILLLGDPGTAKSQLLKFVERASPIGVYTSGKGSSAAGLTASVVRDPHSRNFVMEGGAMVLADGGVVCIDEFDKMREDDRVAIHEAMEQQTISIAKAGITTTLNSRCSVLAAANSVFGRWDETKGEENINFMPTILSRFDMIFIVKDDHNEARDITIAKHVMNVHLKATETVVENSKDELSLEVMKKFVNFCRTRCGPRLSFDAGEKLKTRYVLMRSGVHKHELLGEKSLSIPITVRQLEAIIRMSESLAKMQLLAHATSEHVDEALRLFQVSTLDAAMSGSLAGADEFTSSNDHSMFVKIEKQLKRRFPVGIQASENVIVNDFVKQKYPEHAIRKVIHTLILRGEFVHRMQRKLLLRLK